MRLWLTPPMTNARGRMLAWIGPFGGPVIGYLARFRPTTAANE